LVDALFDALGSDSPDAMATVTALTAQAEQLLARQTD
jgi:hypothetical protein